MVHGQKNIKLSLSNVVNFHTDLTSSLIYLRKLRWTLEWWPKINLVPLPPNPFVHNTYDRLHNSFLFKPHLCCWKSALIRSIRMRRLKPQKYIRYIWFKGSPVARVEHYNWAKPPKLQLNDVGREELRSYPISKTLSITLH